MVHLLQLTHGSEEMEAAKWRSNPRLMATYYHLTQKCLLTWKTMETRREGCVINWFTCSSILHFITLAKVPASKLFLSGDVRANENPVLTSLHTLFVREHNRR